MIYTDRITNMGNKISTKHTIAWDVEKESYLRAQKKYEDKIALLQGQVNSVYAFHSKEIEQKEEEIKLLRNSLDTIVDSVRYLAEKPEDTLVSEIFQFIEESHHTDILERILRYKQAIRFFKSELSSLLEKDHPDVESAPTVSSPSF